MSSCYCGLGSFLGSLCPSRCNQHKNHCCPLKPSEKISESLLILDQELTMNTLERRGKILITQKSFIGQESPSVVDFCNPSKTPVQCTDKEPAVFPDRPLARETFLYKNISGLQLKRVYMVYEKEEK